MKARVYICERTRDCSMIFSKGKPVENDGQKHAIWAAPSNVILIDLCHHTWTK